MAGLIAALFLGGCVAPEPDLYYWGSYESLIHDMYLRPGSAPPMMQIQQLSEDIERARAAGALPAPGVYAHMGYMYASLGQVAQAESAFQQEIALYPDAATLLNGMMARARQSMESPSDVGSAP